MRSVWSFWTKPFEFNRKSAWASEKHHLLAWILSVETARKHYPETSLYTDDEGARMLVDGIGLRFEHVSTELNALHDHNPEWWAIGKLYAYRSQREPFIHIDSDVFLWNRLSIEVESATVFAQSPEHFSFEGGSWYRPKECVAAITSVNGWAPEEWNWYVSLCGNKAACCGVIGGNQVDFLNHYANLGIRAVEYSQNQTAWSLLGNNMGDNLVIEQYSIIACVEYHRDKPSSPFKDIDIQYIFNSPEDAFNPENARRVGYTHLIGDAKRNNVFAHRLEKRVERDYPEYFERCIDYIREAKLKQC